MKHTFNYYIFIDYSENLIGYIIIENKALKNLLPKIVKLNHYATVKHKNKYIIAIKKRFEKEKLENYLFKHKIIELRQSIELFIEIIEFIRKHKDSALFISIDDTYYNYFISLLELIEENFHLLIIKESKLKKFSLEYRLSLIIDTMLIIERKKSN